MYEAHLGRSKLWHEKPRHTRGTKLIVFFHGKNVYSTHTLLIKSLYTIPSYPTIFKWERPFRVALRDTRITPPYFFSLLEKVDHKYDTQNFEL